LITIKEVQDKPIAEDREKGAAKTKKVEKDRLRMVSKIRSLEAIHILRAIQKWQKEGYQSVTKYFLAFTHMEVKRFV
jgi:hypothetical protein